MLGGMVTRRRAETRGRLLDAALRVFAAKGWGQVRIEEICDAAGYTRGAFYSNFDSLDELFFALYDERADLIATQVTAALADPDPSFHHAVERAASTLLLDRDWLLIKTDFLLHAARHPDVAGRLAEHRARLREAIEQRLASTPLTLPAALPDVPAAARAVIAAYDGVTVQLLLDADAHAARTWLTQLLNALLVR
ncbi:TetR family transcriptional regulator [Actinoplanes awajinensis subsp. mycoplanecinus]|uniref:TetR family transcriptional regulator n=2 Tax=Actinoplanes awajinensis TaxID=135946 RepID=A0A101JPX8_9ACTN|nr:TetR family transcriptional regulator [Actinoplanes awajinensis subsp. mycoplanecinus]